MLELVGLAGLFDVGLAAGFKDVADFLLELLDFVGFGLVV